MAQSWNMFAPGVGAAPGEAPQVQSAAPTNYAGAGRGSINPPLIGQAQPEQAPANNNSPTPAWNMFAPGVGLSTQPNAASAPTPAEPTAKQAFIDKVTNGPSVADLPMAALKMGLDFITQKATAAVGDTQALGAQAVNSTMDYLGSKFGWTPEQTNKLKISTDPMDIRANALQAGQDIQDVESKMFTPNQNATTNAVNDLISPVTKQIGVATGMIGNAIGNATNNKVLGETATDLLNFEGIPRATGYLTEKVLPSDTGAAVSAVGQGIKSELSNPVWKDINGNDVPNPAWKSGTRKSVMEADLKDANGNWKYYTGKTDANGNPIPITSSYVSQQGVSLAKGRVGSYEENGVTQPAVKFDSRAFAPAAMYIANEITGGTIPGLGYLTSLYGLANGMSLKKSIEQNYKLNKAANGPAGDMTPTNNAAGRMVGNLAHEDSSRNY